MMTADELRDRLSEVLPEHAGATRSLIQILEAFNGELRAVFDASCSNRGRGRPRDKGRDWLDRALVQVLREEGVEVSGTKGRRSPLIEVVEIAYEFCSYQMPEDQRPSGLRRALAEHAEIVRTERRGTIVEFRETVYPFPQDSWQ